MSEPVYPEPVGDPYMTAVLPIIEKPSCDCEYVDIGVGQQRVTDNPECPLHAPFGLASAVLGALAKAGLLTPPNPSLAGSEASPRVFTFEIPTIPADITKLRDKTGRIWTAVNAGGERTWRFMTLRFTDGTLLASIYGPTFTEVTS